MVVGKVMIIKTRLPGPQKFAGSARTLLRSTRLCHQISATATDCIQATTPSKQDYGLRIFLLATHVDLEVLMIIKDIGSLGFWMGMREEWPLLLFYRGLVQRVSHLCSLDVTRPGGGATNHHGAQVVHKWCTLWCTLWCTEVGSWVGESATANALNSSPSSSPSF